MAGVVVVYNIMKNTQRHYIQHTDTVKCLATHPHKNLIASGQTSGHGDEAKAHVLVWDLKSLETVGSFGHSTFERGLCGVTFLNGDEGRYIVCIDEANEHIVSVWDWEKSLKITETKGSKETIFGIQRHPTFDYMFISYGKSHLGFWTLQSDRNFHLSKKMGVYEKIEKPKYVLCATFTSEGDLFTGDSTGNILLFKKNTNKVFKSAVSAHRGGVFSLALVNDEKALVSCGKNGQITRLTIDLQTIEELGNVNEQFGTARCIVPCELSFIIGTTKNCLLRYNSGWSYAETLTQGHADEMWGLASHPTKQIFATCSQENLVCLWDGQAKRNIWASNIEEHAQCAEFHPTQECLLVGTRVGSVAILNVTTSEEMMTLAVSRDSIDDVKFSPDGRYFAVACRDCCIYFYSWPSDGLSFERPKILKGHSSRVLHLDWTVDTEFLQSSSGDYEVLYWHSESASQVLSPAALRDLQWASWTSPFGFPVMGIWPEGADGTDINACSRSHDNSLVATGDDFGQVKLFRFPCVKLKSESRIGVGHSSHVTCVRFLANDFGLVTVGGKDTSVIQWKLVEDTML